MGTEVLRPHDCLIERIRVPPATAAAFSRRRNFNYYYPHNNINNSSNINNNNNFFQVVSSGRSSRKPATRPEQRKRVERRPGSSDDSRVARNSGLWMEKVTILRRGESLDSALRKEGGDLVVVGTQRLGPDPEMVPTRVRIADLGSRSPVYAGSAFAVSPSPSALPLPSFGKKQPSPAAVVVDDSATRDLRRLLRLE